MSAQLIRFPRAKKRGPKVRTGPEANVLRFPTPLVGPELQRRWVWLNRNWDKWGNEEVDGVRDPDDTWSIENSYVVGQVARGRVTDERLLGHADFAARADIKSWEARIRKRTAVKDWLERMGIDWDDSRTVEDALIFAFDRLSGAFHMPPGAA